MRGESKRWIGPILGLGIGFALGLVLRPAPPTSEKILVPVQAEAPPADTNAATDISEPRPATLSILDRLRAVLSVRNPRDIDISAAVLLIREIELPDCKTAKSLAARLNGEDREVLYEALARRWTALDPVSAFDEAQASRRDNDWANRIGYAAGNALVALNPDAALDRIRSARNNDIRVKSAEWILPALAKTNGKLAAEFLASTPQLNRHEHIYHAVATEYGASSPHEAILWAKSLPTKQLRERSLSSVFNSWAQSDPRAIAAAIETYPELKTNSSAISTAVRALSHSDPKAALAFAQSIEDKEARENALNSLFFDVTKTAGDPDLLKFLTSPGTPANIIENFANEFAREDVHKALAWAESIPAGDARNQAFGKIMAQWAASDPIAAANYLTTQPASNNRASQMANVVGQWSREDPASAAAFAQALPAGRERDLALSRIIENMSEADTQQALALAQSIRDPEAIRRLSGNLLSALGKSNPDAAMQFLARVPPDAQADAYHNFIRAWAPEHNRQAAEWLNTLDPGSGRDAAVKAYVSVIDSEDPALAVRWSTTIQDPVQRVEALFEAFDNWAGEDIQAAGEWLNQSNIPDALRPFFERELANEREKRGQ